MGFLPGLTRVMSTFLVATQATSLVFHSSCVGAHSGRCAPHAGQSRHRGGRRRTGWQHCPSTQHPWLLGTDLQASGKPPATFPSQQNTSREPWVRILLISAVWSSHRHPLPCQVPCTVLAELPHLAWCSAGVAQRPTRCSMAYQHPASNQCSTFIPCYPHFWANTNISESLD